MSGSRLSLEDFAEAPVERMAAALVPQVDVAAIEAAAETARVEAYETGYKTGWDDAVRAAEDERRALGEELARNLRELSFTYFEARDELLLGMRAFLREMIDTLFPALLPEAAASGLADALSALVEEAGNGAIAVSVSPEDAATVRSLLPLPDGVELAVTEEPALAPGQARLKSSGHEVAIDAARVVAMLRDGLSVGTDKEEGSVDG